MRFPTSTHSTDPQLAEAAENGIEIYRDGVQPKLDEEVLAACLFSRQWPCSPVRPSPHEVHARRRGAALSQRRRRPSP